MAIMIVMFIMVVMFDMIVMLVDAVEIVFVATVLCWWSVGGGLVGGWVGCLDCGNLLFPQCGNKIAQTASRRLG